MKIYSNALDELDKKNNAKARQLFQQVVDKYPGLRAGAAESREACRKASN